MECESTDGVCLLVNVVFAGAGFFIPVQLALSIDYTNDLLLFQFKLDSSELRRLEEEESEDVQHQVLQSTAKRLPVTNRTMAGNVRYCERCRAVKPDRYLGHLIKMDRMPNSTVILMDIG